MSRDLEDIKTWPYAKLFLDRYGKEVSPDEFYQRADQEFLNIMKHSGVKPENSEVLYIMEDGEVVVEKGMIGYNFHGSSSYLEGARNIFESMTPRLKLLKELGWTEARRLLGT